LQQTTATNRTFNRQITKMLVEFGRPRRTFDITSVPDTAGST